jgi:hypothetical protein
MPSMMSDTLRVAHSSACAGRDAHATWVCNAGPGCVCVCVCVCVCARVCTHVFVRAHAHGTHAARGPYPRDTGAHTPRIQHKVQANPRCVVRRLPGAPHARQQHALVQLALQPHRAVECGRDHCIETDEQLQGLAHVHVPACSEGVHAHRAMAW